MQDSQYSSKDHRYEYPTGGHNKIDEEENAGTRSYTVLEAPADGVPEEIARDSNIVRLYTSSMKFNFSTVKNFSWLFSNYLIEFS